MLPLGRLGVPTHTSARSESAMAAPPVISRTVIATSHASGYQVSNVVFNYWALSGVYKIDLGLIRVRLQ